MAVIADDFSPIFCGDVGAAFAPQFIHEDGSPVDLTGATISMVMQETSGITKVAAGTWTIDIAANGQAHYSYNAADVDTAGSWTLYIAISISGKPTHADVKQLEIKNVPTV